VYYYMIRKLGTKRYYAGGGHWYSQQVGIIWWHDDGLKLAYKIFERLRELNNQCEVVKFKYEEL